MLNNPTRYVKFMLTQKRFKREIISNDDENHCLKITWQLSCGTKKQSSDYNCYCLTINNLIVSLIH